MIDFKGEGKVAYEDKTKDYYYKKAIEHRDKSEKYEQALVEINEQKGLMEFLDNNEWATSEDYFAHVARKALGQ